MKIEILNRWSLAVIFSHDVDNNTIALTVRAALDAKTDLRSSNLRGSNLRDSDLRDSDLRGSDLRGSDLSGSNLRGSNLRGSDLRGSNLRGSNLRGSDLLPIKADFIEIISQAPREVPALISALIGGRVDGSTYEGECSCLVGTIATAKGVHYRSIDNIKPDSSRAAESFFMNIKKGDTPETNQCSALALQWAKEWHATVSDAFSQ